MSSAVLRRSALALLVSCAGPAPDVARPVAAGSATPAPPVAADAPAPTQEERLAAIEKAMNELDEAAQGCWAASAVERFDIEGEIAATVDIRGPGAATATIARDTTRDARLGGCLVALLEAYPWAPPLHGQAIRLPFRFRAPPGGQNVVDRALVPWHRQGKIALAVLLDELNTGNAAASLVEVAVQAGGSTGLRVAERAELWYFLHPATVGLGGGKPLAVAAGDMVFVPPGGQREVRATADLHAVLAIVPGGREGTIRAGALPTRRSAASPRAPVTARHLPATAVTTYCLGGARPPCPKGAATIFVDAAAVKRTPLAASVLDLPAGMVVPEHVHANETEVLYVLEGAGTMTVAGVAVAVTPTSVVQIPPNTRHAFTATARVRALQIYTPAGPEQRFKPR